jgi:23S rRNA (guanosine2251-2'-O)-methyltransferase
MMEHKKMTDQQQEVIYGLHPVLEAVTAGKEIEKILMLKGMRHEKLAELMPLLKSRSIPYQFVPHEKLNRVTRKNHQGIIAFVSPVTFHRIDQLLPAIYEAGRMPFVVVMDRITDVRNFGAVLRSAEGAGVDAVLIPARNTAQLNAGTVKSSAGAIFKVPLCRSENLKDTLDFLKESGLQIVAATEKTDKAYYNCDMKGPVAVILGSEDEGISPEYLKKADVMAAIPMQGEVGSLNVSVAAGIILFEVARQRNL